MSEQTSVSQEAFLEWLRPIQDPEMLLSLVDLGLIYSVQLNDEGFAMCKMTLTSPGCPAADFLVNEVRKRLTEHPAVKSADVMVVFDPKWDPSTMASDEVKDRMGIW